MVQLYITASNQNIGKTTTTLGLYAALRERGLNIGYCKPVGQQSKRLSNQMMVNKDAVLFSEMMGFPIEPALHSPIAMPRGLTKNFLSNPTNYKFNHQLLSAAKKLRVMHEVIIYEGSGHPGVGSVINLSNAKVAQLVGASVILIVTGGIGSTIDQINLNLSLFREYKVPIIGVIINKVRLDKLEEVRHYVGLKLKRLNIPLLGVIPYEDSLSKPIFETIQKAVEGIPLMHATKLDNVINEIVSGALIERSEYNSLENLLLIVNYRRLESTLNSIINISEKHHLTRSPLSGILIHGEGEFIPSFLKNFKHKAYLEKYKIPLVATSLDTYGSAVRINKINVKINSRTPWKVKKAHDLIKEHIDFDLLL